MDGPTTLYLLYGVVETVAGIALAIFVGVELAFLIAVLVSFGVFHIFHAVLTHLEFEEMRRQYEDVRRR